MIVEEFSLPTGAEADYLLSGLGRLIELKGFEGFVSGPLLLPEPQFFPDPVEARAKGVAVLLRRLLAYARLEPSRIEVEIYESGQDPMLAVDQPGHGQSAAAWFMGIADGVYRFGVRETELRDEKALIGTLGHEVAHAFRTHHQLVVRDRETEEKLTDLTTIYLGFGVFTLESSFQFKTGHYSSTGQQLLYERQTRGYLLPGQLAFLLAAQLSARSCGKATVAKVLSALSANHAQAVRSAYEQFSRDPLPLTAALGLPPREQWPLPEDIAESAVPLAPTEVHVHDAPNARKAQSQSERIAFRVAGNRSLVGLGLGLATGFSAGVYFELVTAFWPLTLGAGVVAWVVGKRIPAPTCSACSRSVASRAATCACKARLVGDIKKPEERFSAEEDYIEHERERRAEET